MSAAPMLPLAEARSALLAAAPPPPDIETVALAAARGRLLAAPLHALLDVPPCDNSAMDGYALAAADAGRELPVALTCAAGDAPGELAPGTAARIFTGAPIPAGADAVVPQEDYERRGERV
jgi:molybdopterin molybdotransferase